MDRQTDDACRHIPRLCIASRGKKAADEVGRARAPFVVSVVARASFCYACSSLVSVMRVADDVWTASYVSLLKFGLLH